MIAMSGGVDSSVAAYIIKKSGYDAIGVTLKLFENDGERHERTCCSLDDINDARDVATALDIPYYVLNFTDNFKEKVIDRFVLEYRKGHTPNPCIDCNRYIKFHQLMERAKALGIDYVVTGHYARCEYDEETGRYLLKKAVDKAKDQSYVLYSMTQEQLSKTLFPLGELTKTQVREIADEMGFRNFDKPDSQDICFVQNGRYTDFIESYCGFKFEPGNFVDSHGKILGKHNGIIGYTVGQRKGLGISADRPLYVIDKDVESNTITLGDEKDLYSKSLTAYDVNFISIDKLEKPMHIKARTRYHQKETAAVIKMLDEGRVLVEFEEPQKFIASGQAVVFYDGDVVVGGGTIE
ncbi:MAG: tRNA 2-thiouridine(34) synthase MnmA [Clostridia bacterium]|nr:tRNA 2-thiouridine(34) synthase MnmA [Clostridia bacterium]